MKPDYSEKPLDNAPILSYASPITQRASKAPILRTFALGTACTLLLLVAEGAWTLIAIAHFQGIEGRRSFWDSPKYSYYLHWVEDVPAYTLLPLLLANAVVWTILIGYRRRSVLICLLFPIIQALLLLVFAVFMSDAMFQTGFYP
jgi:hypothetical protein